jgi:hypothetical protein
VLPILLYGSENWILTESLLTTVEKFQAEIGRRILRLPKFYSYLAVIIALHWPRMRVCILLRKLTFLVKLLQSTSDNLSSRVFRTLASEDVSKISLVEQCQLLESESGTSFAAQCLNDPGNAQLVLQEAKEALISRDWEIVLEMAKCHQSTKHIADPRIASSWCKLWDIALDHGVRGTRLTQHLLSVMCRPVFGKRECPICNNIIHQSTSYFEHVSSDHCNSVISVAGVLETIEGGFHENILTIATTLSNSL